MNWLINKKKTTLIFVSLCIFQTTRCEWNNSTIVARWAEQDKKTEQTKKINKPKRTRLQTIMKDSENKEIETSSLKQYLSFAMGYVTTVAILGTLFYMRTCIKNLYLCPPIS